jgi:hypothetical protein
MAMIDARERQDSALSAYFRAGEQRVRNLANRGPIRLTAKGTLALDIVYDAGFVRKRSEMIGYAIDARRQHFVDEKHYVYRPHAQGGEVYRWSEAARGEIDAYYTRDLNI